MQNARSDRVCLDLSLLRFFVSRQRNEEIDNCIIGAVWCLERLARLGVWYVWCFKI
jgi:hypothetical protein